MIRYLFLMVCICLLSVDIQAGNNIQFEEYELDNGLDVILHQDNSTPIVVVSILYHVGSKNENPERTGFAHFFEHLLFEGSKNVGRGEFDKLVTNAGGINNAYTSVDETYYYEVFPSNQLELGLYLESERLLHAKIDQVGVNTQREVVKEEKRQRIDNRPYGSFFTEILSHSYEVHPYKWAPIGDMEHINAATLEEFMDFYETFYVPENATLVIAGDIEYPKTKELVRKYFSGIEKTSKAGTIPRPTEIEPKKTEEVRDVIYDNIQLPAVLAAYHVPEMKSEETYALSMLATLLSGGKSSILNKVLVDDQQLAVEAATYPFTTENPGLYIVYSIASFGTSADKLEEEMNKIIEEVKKNGVSDYDFEKIRNQVENDFVNQNSTLEGIANSLASYSVFYDDTNLINTEIDKLMAVTKEDIQSVAQKYLNKENRALLHYLPKIQ